MKGLAVRARGRVRPTPGAMNKTEEAYASYLEARRLGGEIHAWRFEPMRLRLASRTFYEPDFLVIERGGEVEFHEVKGHWEDDARVKIKVAATQYPWFRFTGVTRKRKVWQFEDFPARWSGS